MNNKTLWIVGGVIVVAGMVWYAMSGSSSAPAAGGQASSAPEQASPAESSLAQVQGTTTPAASVKEFTVTGQNFSFTPKTLTVSKGDTVKVTFVNSDGFHDFRIDEFNVATNKLQTGGQQTVTFVADKTGSFEYYCSVGNHRAMGMKGTLVVQ